jgi:hypothetical protein
MALELRSRLRLAAFAACLVSFAGSARASDPDEARARAHFERGYTLAERGAFSEAIAEFEAAQALRSNVSLLYNLGQAYAAAGRSAEAVATLERYLADGGAAVTPERRRQAEGLLLYHAPRVGRIQLEIEPAGAAVSIDGKPVGRAPLPSALPVTPGQHALVISADGYAATATAVDARAQETSSLTLRLTPLPRKALLVVRCPLPDVQVTLDDLPLGKTPLLEAAPAQAGQHRLTFARPGYRDQARSVSLTAGSPTEVSCTLEPDPSYQGAGKLRVSHPSGTRVLVDGAPFRGQSLPEGRHRLSAVGLGFDTDTRWVTIARGGSHQLTLKPSASASSLLGREAEQRRRLRFVAYVSAGLGLASAITATALYLDTSAAWKRHDERVSQLRASTAANEPLYVPQVDQLLDREATLRNRDALAVGFGVAGATLLLGGVALFVATRAPATSWTVTAGSGVAVRHAF